MQIALLKVDDATAGGVFYVGVANVPLFGNRPVEDLCTRCHLVDRQRQQLADLREALAQPIAGDAAADGKQLAHQFNQVASRRLGVDEASQIRQSSDVEIHRYPVVGEHRATIEIAESLIERSTRKARKQDAAFGALEVPTRKRRATTTRYTSVHGR